jgi:hypothetical protein
MYDGFAMPTDTVDETASHTGMMGGASAMNQTAGSRVSILSSPTKSLLVLWFVVLAVYWFVGWFFKSARS